jgi:hypothetical protein
LSAQADIALRCRDFNRQDPSGNTSTLLLFHFS